MKCLISIGKFSLRAYIRVILLFGLSILILYIRENMDMNEKEKSEKLFDFILFLFISESLSIFVFFYRYGRTKKKSFEKENRFSNEIRVNNSNFIKYEDKQKNDFQNCKSFFPNFKKNYGSYALIFFISLSDFFSYFFLMRYRFNYYGVSGICGLILFNCLFKCQTYKHHYLSLFILTLTSSGQITISIIVQLKYKKKIDEQIVLEILYNICNSFILVSEKYLIDKKDIDSFIILFFEGIFGLFCTIIVFFCSNYDDFFDFFKNFSKLSGLDIFLTFSYIIVMLFINVIKFLLSENTPSIYNLLTFNITVYFSRIIYFQNTSYFKNIYYLSNFILNIFNIFAMLIFIEIIIFNFCGLNYNTRDSIKKREEEEDKNKCLIEEDKSSFILYKTEDNENKNSKILMDIK